MTHTKSGTEAIGEILGSGEGAGYQGVGQFDGHEDCYQSAREGYINGLRGRGRGEVGGVGLADYGEGDCAIEGLLALLLDYGK